MTCLRVSGSLLYFIKFVIDVSYYCLFLNYIYFVVLGYINEGGSLHLERFQKYMEKLAAFDFEQFKEYSADLKYFEAKSSCKQGERQSVSWSICCTVYPIVLSSLPTIILPPHHNFCQTRFVTCYNGNLMYFFTYFVS